MIDDENFLLPEPQSTRRMICFPIEEESLRKAAPELLAACEGALKTYEDHGLYGPDKLALIEAIKKARGGE